MKIFRIAKYVVVTGCVDVLMSCEKMKHLFGLKEKSEVER